MKTREEMLEAYLHENHKSAVRCCHECLEKFENVGKYQAKCGFIAGFDAGFARACELLAGAPVGFGETTDYADWLERQRP